MTFKAIIYQGDKYSALEVRKIRSRQDKPYTEPLPYSSFVWDERDSRTRYYSASHNTPSGTFSGSYLGYLKERYEDGKMTPSKNQKNIVWNKALVKAESQLAYISNLFEAWYERREAYSLLGTCMKAILTFTKRWKDPRYWKEMRKLHGKTMKDPTSLPQAWLLWNFALKPLVGTVEDVFTLLEQPIPVEWIEGSSGLRTEFTIGEIKPESGVHVTGSNFFLVKHGYKVKAVNPNTALINSFGISTPLSTAMSVVPWGWAVNYFINVNEVLSNFELRFPGVSIVAGYSTTFSTTKYEGYYGLRTQSKIDPWLPENGFYVYRNPIDYVGYNGSVIDMKRVVGLPSFRATLKYPPLGKGSFANLASAIALTMAGAKKK